MTTNKNKNDNNNNNNEVNNNNNNNENEDDISNNLLLEHHDRYDFEPLESSSSFLVGGVSFGNNNNNNNIGGRGLSLLLTPSIIEGGEGGEKRENYWMNNNTKQQQQSSTINEWQLPKEFQRQHNTICEKFIYELKRYGWYILDIIERYYQNYQMIRKRKLSKINKDNPYGVYIKKQQQQHNQEGTSAFAFVIKNIYYKIIHLPLHVKLLCIGAFCIGILFGYDLNIGKKDIIEQQQQMNVINTSQMEPQLQQKPIKAVSTIKELLGLLSKEKLLLWNTIYETDYGIYKDIIFDKNRIMRHIFKMNDISRERMIRKLMIKVLQGQIMLHQKEEDINSHGKKKRRSSNIYDNNNSSLLRKQGDEIYFTWVTTGDSAAAGHGNMYGQSYTSVLQQTVYDAFHVLGITFQSYNRAIGNSNSGIETSMCMKSLFSIVDHNNEKNENNSDNIIQTRRMIDVLSWDYSRTDRGIPYDKRVKFWAKRASTLNDGTAATVSNNNENNNNNVNEQQQQQQQQQPTSSTSSVPPILFMMDSSERSAWSYISNYEQTHGLTTILMDEYITMGTMLWKERIPDTLKENNLLLPKALNNYMCHGHIEGSIPCHVDEDQPATDNEQYNNHRNHYWCDTLNHEEQQFCLNNKYNTNEFCPIENQFGQTSWNPGWKYHTMIGRLIGYMLLELLEESIKEIDIALLSLSSKTSLLNSNELNNLLQKLLSQEQYEKLNHSLSSTTLNQQQPPPQQQGTTDEESSVVFNDPVIFRMKLEQILDDNNNDETKQYASVICRTGLLPSYSSLQYGLRDASIHAEEMEELLKNKQDHSSLLLTLVKDDKERPKPHCDGLKFDFHDYFVVLPNSSSSTTTTTTTTTQFPTVREYHAYGTSSLNDNNNNNNNNNNDSSLLLLCPRYCKSTPTTHSNCHDESVLKPYEWIAISNDNNNNGIGIPTFDIWVYNQKVTNLVEYDGCYFLWNDTMNGPYWPYYQYNNVNQQPNDDNNEQIMSTTTSPTPPPPPPSYALSFSTQTKQVQISSIIAIQKN